MHGPPCLQYAVSCDRVVAILWSVDNGRLNGPGSQLETEGWAHCFLGIGKLSRPSLGGVLLGSGSNSLFFAAAPLRMVLRLDWLLLPGQFNQVLCSVVR